MHQRARQLLGHGPLAVTILEHLNAAGGKVPNFSIYNEHSESTASTKIAYFHAALFNVSTCLECVDILIDLQFSNLVYTTFRVMYECMIAMRICMLQTDSAMSTAATLTVVRKCLLPSLPLPIDKHMNIFRIIANS